MAIVRKMGDTMIGINKCDNFHADKLIKNYLRPTAVQETFPKALGQGQSYVSFHYIKMVQERIFSILRNEDPNCHLNNF